MTFMRTGAFIIISMQPLIWTVKINDEVGCLAIVLLHLTCYKISHYMQNCKPDSEERLIHYQDILFGKTVRLPIFH